jgi:hypothetical protein
MSEAIDKLIKMDLYDLLTGLVGAAMLDRNTAPYIDQIGNRFESLRDEYVKLFRLAEPIAKMLTELTILPIGCSREQELAWKMAVKNFRHYQRDYAADVLLQAALTPQAGKGGAK